MIHELVVRGRLVLEQRIIEGEVGIHRGKIVEVSEQAGKLEGQKLLDFGSSYIFPGMIDAHVHCFSNPLEGFIPTTAAAAAGGITTIFDMPYDLPNPITTVERFIGKREQLEREALVDVALWATIAKHNGVAQIMPLAEAGAVAFKMSTFETDAYRFPSISDTDIIEAMETIRTLGLRAAFHAENGELIHDAIKAYEASGRTDYRAHTDTRPPVTETSAVLKLLEYAYWTKAKLHIVHVSHPRSVELIDIYRTMGVDVTAEYCYPHLLLDSSVLDRLGPKARINPPLREAEDMTALWEKLLQSSVNIIASDHAPWGEDRKGPGVNNIFRAASGMPGVEFMVPLLFDHCVIQEGISPIKLAEWLSRGPATIYGLAGKGSIAAGYDADLTVIDPSKDWRIDEHVLRSNSKLTPFHGYSGKGKIVHTIVRGTTVFDGERVLAEPGFGRFVAGYAAKEEVLL